MTQKPSNHVVKTIQLSRSISKTCSDLCRMMVCFKQMKAQKCCTQNMKMIFFLKKKVELKDGIYCIFSSVKAGRHLPFNL